MCSRVLYIGSSQYLQYAFADFVLVFSTAAPSVLPLVTLYFEMQYGANKYFLFDVRRRIKRRNIVAARVNTRGCILEALYVDEDYVYYLLLLSLYNILLAHAT